MQDSDVHRLRATIRVVSGDRSTWARRLRFAAPVAVIPVAAGIVFAAMWHLGWMGALGPSTPESRFGSRVAERYEVPLKASWVMVLFGGLTFVVLRFVFKRAVPATAVAVVSSVLGAGVAMAASASADADLRRAVAAEVALLDTCASRRGGGELHVDRGVRPSVRNPHLGVPRLTGGRGLRQGPRRLRGVGR